MKRPIITYQALGENGRLGNQLFQIAATFSHHKRFTSEIVLPPWDYSFLFPNVTKHCMVMARENIKSMVTHHYREPHFYYSLIPQHGLDFLPALDIATEKYVINLHGYFQSEKYFDCPEYIRSTLFEFAPEVLVRCKNLIHEVLISNPGRNLVSMHMRFGDYVNNPYYANLIETEYYHRAIEYICSNVEDPLFLVFSDDKKMAETACAKIEASTAFELPFLCLANTTEAEDLCLQSLCKHHIIANSSFSWWSSYLSKAPNPLVIAPAQWFGNAGLDTKDLYRREMIKL